MDRTILGPQKWAKIIEDELNYRAVKPLNADLEPSVVADHSQNRFVLLFTGWHEGEMIDEVVAHIEIRGDKIWVFDRKVGLDFIVPELLGAGLAPENLVLPVLESSLVA